MDKSWMLKSRYSKEYAEGVEGFIRFVLKSGVNPKSMKCPCVVCGNMKYHDLVTVKDHLFLDGIHSRYKKWSFHGEDGDTIPSASHHESFDVGDDLVIESNIPDDAPPVTTKISTDEPEVEGLYEDPEFLTKALEEGSAPLYPGCLKYTKLSALVELWNLKAKFGVFDNFFTAMLQVFGEMLPDEHLLPQSLYEARRQMNSLGMQYQKIHACPNDCMLYWKDDADKDVCRKCGLSRYKVKRGSNKVIDNVPAKVLWYFPPIPRFKKMFLNKQTSWDLRWHSRNMSTDGKMRHPVDSPSWHNIDRTWPHFAQDPRNLRLALSTDGFNPFQFGNSTYSMWPVIMVIYNLPPWLIMKRKFMMLSLLISGPKQPGNDIDVYLQPLIEDLKSLWNEGVTTYDAYRCEAFNLRAILMWTINDFPAYGNMSGHKVKGKYGCPVCSDNTCSQYLNHSQKMCYMGHRRFLPHNHPFRRQAKVFNGSPELEEAPQPLTGEEIVSRLHGLNFKMGKKPKGKKGKEKDKGKRKPKVKKTNEQRFDKDDCFKKKSIFFELPYWSSHYVRHMLDVMHIEKNICDSLVGTLLKIPGKNKDTLMSRRDLVDMGIRSTLHPKPDLEKGHGFVLPPSPFDLNDKQIDTFCSTLAGIKAPEGYCSNFGNIVSVDDHKLNGMKTHDHHILLQQFLPLCIRSMLPRPTRIAITRLCFFFNGLCKKEIDVESLMTMQQELVITLCMFEKFFPPSFFDIMVHLTVHLVREVRLCGPVHYRWMYPFERYMKILKGYVRNRRRPEGCIAESYIAEEALELGAFRVTEVQTVGIPSGRSVAKKGVNKPLHGGCVHTIGREEWEKAHMTVLMNTGMVIPLIRQHKALLRAKNMHRTNLNQWVDDEHARSFITWFRATVSTMVNHGDPNANETLTWLAVGPSFNVTKHQGYDVNGRRYLTHDRDSNRVNQNSGVTLVSDGSTYYGVIQEIWDLDYRTMVQTLFKCNWVNLSTGIKVVDLGYTSVNHAKLGFKNDPFILATHASQCFYIDDQCNPRWSIVQMIPKPWQRENEEMGDTVAEVDSFLNELPNVAVVENDDDESTYQRTDIEGTHVDDPDE